MSKIGITIRKKREQKKILTRELASLLQIDAAMISRFEKGTRLPSKNQLIQLASILEINEKSLMVQWLSEKILNEVGDEELAIEAMKVAEEVVKYNRKKTESPIKESLQKTLKAIDQCKKTLSQFRKFDSQKIVQALELEYTYESNRIEGNTLTLKETNLVISKGLTISGKSMQEHLEAINHTEAVDFIRHLVDKKTNFTERDLLSIHNLILRGIDSENAGKYRKVQVMISGSSHLPPSPLKIRDEMDALFNWYQGNKNTLHPVVLAAEMHERLVTIHPFIDGNGRTSRLVMNLILLQNGYALANIKGDSASRLAYYNALENAQTQHDKNDFLELVSKTTLESMKKYLQLLKG